MMEAVSLRNVPSVKAELDAARQRLRDLRAQTASAASAPAPAPPAAPDANDTTCAICFERERTHVFVPCGHKSVCEVCSKLELRSCPICRAKVERVMRVFG